jgi:FtsP/CotA-like multicopper oxidase with cupredoxin domain
MPHVHRAGRHVRSGKPVRHSGSPRTRAGRRLTALTAVVILVLAGAPGHLGGGPKHLATHEVTVHTAAGPTPTPAPGDAPELPPRPITGPDVQSVRNLGDGTKLAAWRVVNNVKIFDLRISQIDWATAPGVTRKAMAINGSVPAPTIRVNQGERVRFVVHNNLPEPTSIHWHGMDLPNDMDGVPGITQQEIPPGAQFTYEWTAISAGTHWYHSHMHGDQEGRGVYGALEVVPLADDIAADRDYTLIFADGPLGYVVNGKGFPASVRMPARVGDRVRIRLIGAGPDLIHSIHLHSGFFQVVAQDGHRLPAPYEADTVVLGVGQTYDLIWVPTRVGHWMIHCHIFAHSEAKRGMTGMVTFFDVYPADGAAAPAVPGTGDISRDREP